MRLAIMLVISYLIGSIPTAVWLGKLVRKIDIRDYGSGNSGATNALRVLGVKWGLVVMALDISKGLAAVLLVVPLLSVSQSPHPVLLSVLAGTAAIVGHIFPVTIGFRGGKGVGTSAGVMFALAPWVALTALTIWLLVVAATRYVSLGSMVAALSVAPLLILRSFLLHVSIEGPLLVFAILLAVVVLVSHRANIRRLLQGRENRLTLGGSRTGRRTG
jgi:glycerol-3-phosphate acyltransferase PlsY